MKNPCFEIVSSILNEGPSQPIVDNLPDRQFPKDNNDRRFHAEWYNMILPDGKSAEKRNWLSYSICMNRIYCINCMLFSKLSKESSNLAWTKNGFNTWSRGKLAIERHETTTNHISCSIQRLIRQSLLPIIPSLLNKRKEDVLKNRDIVKQLIDITLFLGRHSLSFRGHREDGTAENRGNFLDLVELVSKYSPLMCQYITELQMQKKTRMFIFILEETKYVD